MSFIEQENNILLTLKQNIISALKQKDLTYFKEWLRDKGIIFNNNLNELDDIINKLNFSELIFINTAEQLNLIKFNEKLMTDHDKLISYINNKKLKVSFSINDNDNIINYHDKEIHSMHSIGKVFTGILVIILIDRGIINENDLNKELKLDNEVLEKLPNNIKVRLNETTMYDVMTHNSGLMNYLPNYINDIINFNKIPNPIEPEDFLKYIDEELSKSRRHYSNLGLLLIGLSIKHLYNSKLNTNLTYNEILNKFIINEFNLTTFSVNKPLNAMFNDKDNISQHINGSPGGGYWISCEELRIFGEKIKEMFKTSINIKRLIKLYGSEFYDENTNIISHNGKIPASSAQLKIDLNNNIIVSIMSSHYDDAVQLHQAMLIFK
jgi:hypothetical protein